MAEANPIPTYPRFNDRTGQRFGMLRVESYAGTNNKARRRQWNCVCDCGGKQFVRRAHEKLRMRASGSKTQVSQTSSAFRIPCLEKDD